MFLQMFEYVIFPQDVNYPVTVDAYDVAQDELDVINENPQALDEVEKENAQVFIIPADKKTYWAYPENTGNPKKWCEKPRKGMVQLIIPAIIETGVTYEKQKDSEEDY